MKLSKVGFIVVHHTPSGTYLHLSGLGLSFDDGSTIADNDLPKRHIGTSLFYDESVTVFESRRDAKAAIKRTEKFRFQGEMKIVPVNGVEAE